LVHEGWIPGQPQLHYCQNFERTPIQSKNLSLGVEFDLRPRKPGNGRLVGERGGGEKVAVLQRLFVTIHASKAIDQKEFDSEGGGDCEWESGSLDNIPVLQEGFRPPSKAPVRDRHALALPLQLVAGKERCLHQPPQFSDDQPVGAAIKALWSLAEFVAIQKFLAEKELP